MLQLNWSLVWEDCKKDVFHKIWSRSSLMDNVQYVKANPTSLVRRDFGPYIVVYIILISCWKEEIFKDAFSILGVERKEAGH